MEAIKKWLTSTPGDKKVMLIRAIDGFTIDWKATYSFMEFLETENLEVQLVFQYVKVYNQIRHSGLVPVRGLGSVVSISSNDFRNHM